jgi:molybdate transport system regulatory protein
MKTDVHFRVRFYKEDSVVIGPGKIELLEAIAQEGSISGAGRLLGMSYRRAWVLVSEMNHLLTSPAVNASTGGSHGGGATLTAVGKALIKRYRSMEAAASAAAASDIAAIKRLIAK